MKLFIAVFLAASFSYANDDLPPLKDSMERLKVEFRTIAQGISAGEMTDDHVVATENLQMAAADGSLVYPNTAENDERKLLYSLWMREMVREGLKLEVEIEGLLEKATLPQDLTKVKEIFAKLNDLRKKGHDEFKE